MSPGAVGPVEARTILSSAHRGPAAELVALLDAAHARLHAERRALALAEQAVASIAEEPFDDPRTTDAMTITELAGALGVRPIGPLKELMPQFREARRWEELRTTLAAREAAPTARSRALLHGAAPLSALLSATDPPS